MLGLSWGDVADAGKAAFPYVHATGKGIASAFGAGVAADALENVEQKQGWLPKTMPSATATVASTVQSTATTLTPKLHPGVSPKVPPKPTPVLTPPTATTPSTPATAAPAATGGKTATKLSTGVIVGGVGVLGLAALVLHRLWGAH